MQKRFGKKAIAVAIAATITSAIFVGTAFALPILQPGQTSAPGMSGTCSNCHQYAKAATPKKRVVSHPFAAKGKHHVTKDLKVWGYINPKLPNTENATLTISVKKLVGKSWNTSSTLAATGTVTPKGHFKKKTNYAATLHIVTPGKYRLRAKLVFLDAKGVEHTKWSKVFTVRMFK